MLFLPASVLNGVGMVALLAREKNGWWLPSSGEVEKMGPYTMLIPAPWCLLRLLLMNYSILRLLGSKNVKQVGFCETYWSECWKGTYHFSAMRPTCQLLDRHHTPAENYQLEPKIYSLRSKKRSGLSRSCMGEWKLTKKQKIPGSPPSLGNLLAKIGTSFEAIGLQPNAGHLRRH